MDELTQQFTQTQQDLNDKNRLLQQKEANMIVKNHVLSGSLVSLMPLPLFDVVALTGAQLNMLRRLCQHYKINFNQNKAKSLLLSLIGGSLPALTVIGVSSLFKFIPGIGTLGGSTGVSLLGGSVTYATGQTFIKHFSAGGTLEDFEPKRFSPFFKTQLKKGKTLTIKKAV